MNGVCFSNLKITNVDRGTDGLGFYHKFTKSTGKTKLNNGVFKVNDTIVISCLKTPPEIAIAIGTIIHLSDNEISLYLDK